MNCKYCVEEEFKIYFLYDFFFSEGGGVGGGKNQSCLAIENVINC